MSIEKLIKDVNTFNKFDNEAQNVFTEYIKDEYEQYHGICDLFYKLNEKKIRQIEKCINKRIIKGYNEEDIILDFKILSYGPVFKLVYDDIMSNIAQNDNNNDNNCDDNNNNDHQDIHDDKINDNNNNDHQDIYDDHKINDNNNNDYQDINNNHKINNNKFSYRYGQNIAVKKFKSILELPEYWGLLVAPTGWGKSMIHLLFIGEFWKKSIKSVFLITKKKDILHDLIDGIIKKIGWLKKWNKFPNVKFEIVDQVNKFNIKEINNVKSHKRKLVIINSDKLITRKFSKDGKNKMNKRLDKIKWNKFNFVIFDEGHHTGAKKIFKFMEYAKNKIKYCIASSATPLRADIDNQTNIKSLFGCSKTKELNILYELTYEEAWKHKIILPIKHDYFVVSDFSKTIDCNGRSIYKFKNSGKRTIIKRIKEYTKVSAYKKLILFFGSKKSLLKWYEFINNKYFTNYSLHISFSNSCGNNSQEINEKIKSLNINREDIDNGIRNFKKEETNAILFVVHRATEGFDDPRVDIVANLDYALNRSITLLLQKIGRAQRLCEGKKYGYYISPMPDLGKDQILDFIGKIISDYIGCVTSGEADVNDNDNILLTNGFVDIINNYMKITGNYIISHDEIVEKIREINNNISCRRAMNIIKNHKEKCNLELESKEEYYKLCDKEAKLPKNPDKYYEKHFPGWPDYLGINRSKYYSDYKECKISIGNIIKNNKNEIKKIKDNYCIYNFCKEKDQKIPPFPTEFYKNDYISNISQLLNIMEKKNYIHDY